MATADNGGWDFIKKGKTYQYKQGDLVGIIKILKIDSTEKNYIFDVIVEKASVNPRQIEFKITHKKDLNDEWVAKNVNDMIQIYPKPEIKVDYNWENKNKK